MSQARTMSPMLQWFCHLVMQLDRVPRYGRLYPWNGPGGVKDRIEAKHKGRPVPRKAVRWHYQRRGRWGMNLLQRMGLMWRYFDATQPWRPNDPDVPVR
jgi:hypothetical protein